MWGYRYSCSVIREANDKQQQMDERNRQLESKLAEAARCLEILENDNAKKTRLIQVMCNICQSRKVKIFKLRRDCHQC